MSIANFKKITVFGMRRDRAKVLEQMQTLGSMHLISINPHHEKNITTPSTTLVDQIKKALKYLHDSKHQGEQKTRVEQFNADQVVLAVLENQHLLRELSDQYDMLQKRIKDLSPWGNFILPKEGELDNFKLWFYQIKHKDIPKIPKDLVIQETHRDNMYVYLVVLAKEEPPLSQMPFPRIHTGSVPLNNLKHELISVKEKIDDAKEERLHLTRYYHLLESELSRFNDLSALKDANEKVQDQNEFFILQGWVPNKKLSAMKNFCKKQKLSMLVQPASPKELPPTLLETYPWASAGREIINFYQTPNYHSLDPSLVMFFSFSLFFAMILADAGYGLIFAIITLLSLKWLNRSSIGSWLKPLLILISIFSIAYGVIVGSYFGVSPPANSFLGKLHILDLHDFSTMMKVVIGVGCLHIIVANLMRAYFAKSFFAKMHSIGYSIFIIGIMMLSLGLLNDMKMLTTFAIIIIAISLLTLMITASDHPVTDVKSLGKRTVHGFLALAELPSLFCDILSYLRLFALGLAGASLAITFNKLAMHISATTLNGHGWIFGFLVLLFGQTLNFLLCILGGVIHGLRLNYIEFFKWSVKEEGYEYMPLKKTSHDLVPPFHG